MLSEWVGSAPGVVEWYEPNQLWRVGSAYRADDSVPVENATPFVKKWIRGKFLRFQEEHDGRRIVEKSPTNVLRVKFVREIFPEAKLVHIYRDGRAALRSQIEKYKTFESYTITESDTLSRLRSMLRLVPFWEWPAYAPRFFEGVTRRYVSRREGVKWFGLRYPGWQADAARLGVTQLAAKQWTVAVETALADLGGFPAGSWLSLRYEDVVADPAKWFRRICEFCEIEANEQYLEQVTREIHTQSLEKWKSELTPEVLAEAMQIMEPTLRRLGYLESQAGSAKTAAAATT